MNTDPKAMVQKLWDYCDVLRDDGLSYGDYLEQLTYLLFLKMADEQYELLGERVVPPEYGWQSLLNRSGVNLEEHYNEALAVLGQGDDMLGVVFRKARNRVQNPAKLELLIKDFIDGHEWLSLDADLKGDAYEGLIEKTAREGARGAGQYFTPRAPDRRHRRCDGPRPRGPYLRPGLRHRRVLPGRLPVDRRALLAPRSRPGPPICGLERSPAGRSPSSPPGCAP